MMFGNLENEHVIIGIGKNQKGEIVTYKLEDGRCVSKYEVVELSREGAIAGISCNMSDNKQDFLKSLPEYEVNMNLWNLPTI